MGAATFRVGAVAYDPKVVTIWEGFKQYFVKNGLPFDFVLYSNYETQVEAHLAGSIDAAWNSPLAWIETLRAADALGRTAHEVAMRDTDRDLSSVIVVRDDGPAELADLKGGTLAVGAADSPQATLIPLLHVAESGVEPGTDFQYRLFDVLPGKHGDHIGGERDAARALVESDVDAACMIDGNHLAFVREGTLPPGRTRVLARTGRYDHCNFTVLDDPAAPRVRRFVDLLLAMSYDQPRVRALLDMEGLKKWDAGRTSGYELLGRAVERFAAIDGWLATINGPGR